MVFAAHGFISGDIIRDIPDTQLQRAILYFSKTNGINEGKTEGEDCS